MVSGRPPATAESMETKSAAHPDVCYGVLVRTLSAAGCVRPGRGSILRARSSGREQALHRRNDFSRDAVDPVRPDARHHLQPLNEFSRCVCSGRSRSTTPSSGTTPRPDRTTTSIARTPKSCPTSLRSPAEFDIPPPDGMSVAAIDVIVRLKKTDKRASGRSVS